MATLLVPELLFDAHGKRAEGPLLVGDDGRVLAVGPEADRHATRLGDDVIRETLLGKMLLPAFTNAHSHAFQRALRGRVEARAGSVRDDDFWSWRTQMYACALRATEAQIETLATWAYADMLRSGFSAVGEFHYLHHAPDGQSWGLTSSQALSRGAARVGIRIALLQTAYERAGPNAPPHDDQRRFVFPHPDKFLEHARAARMEKMERVTHGLAIHSVRACTRALIEAVAQEAENAALPLHVHACEQVAELEICRAEHGLTPLALLEAASALGARTTIVHATHIDDEDVARLAETKTGVCLCPSTERNLGDGLCPIDDLARAGVPLSLGSDSHARIDVADELRSLEDHERLRTQRRSVLPGADAGMAASVLKAATYHGPASLGLEPGGVHAGALADLTAIQIPLQGRAHPRFALDAWLVGGSGGDVRDLWIGGERVLKQGRLTQINEEELDQQVIELLSSF